MACVWDQSLAGEAALHVVQQSIVLHSIFCLLQSQCANQMYLPIALELISEMRARNIPLNTHTYSSMLNVCVKVGEVELALDVFNQVPRGGTVQNWQHCSTLAWARDCLHTVFSGSFAYVYHRTARDAYCWLQLL